MKPPGVGHDARQADGYLDDGARDLLAAASVLGTEFGSGLAAAVCGAAGDATAELSAAGARGLTACAGNEGFAGLS
jgi:hypothetical protein